MIIDTHIHLYDEQYRKDLDRILHDARFSDVGKMIVVGCDKETSFKAIRMAKEYDSLYASVGLHPSEIQKDTDNDVSWIYALAKEEKVVAIGEIGLDYYWDKTYSNLQKELFISQIEIAKTVNLPIIVHSRDASADTYRILKEHRTPGVLHCYSQSLELAREYTKLGYYLGIGGVVTYKNSKDIKEVVKAIPLEYLVTETDGPYLAPTPFRGKRNEPAFLSYIISEIAKLKNTDIETVKNILERNSKNLFKI